MKNQVASPRAEPLSPERVIEAAMLIADKEGLEALSMRRLAASLGVKAMSLYNHVANREAIIFQMVEQVIGEMAIPSLSDNWKTALRQRAQSARKVLLAHPWAAIQILSQIRSGPNSLRYTEAVLATLVQAGFSYAMADYAWNLLDHHTYGFTLQQLNFPFAPSEYAKAARDYIQHVSAESYPHLQALIRRIADGEHSGIQDFDFGLELILDGLERLLNENEKSSAELS